MFATEGIMTKTIAQININAKYKINHNKMPRITLAIERNTVLIAHPPITLSSSYDISSPDGSDVFVLYSLQEHVKKGKSLIGLPFSFALFYNVSILKGLQVICIM